MWYANEILSLHISRTLLGVGYCQVGHFPITKFSVTGYSLTDHELYPFCDREEQLKQGIIMHRGHIYTNAIYISICVFKFHCSSLKFE